MTLRERIADWISGGELSRLWLRCGTLSHEARGWPEEAANIAAQRDEAIARAEAAEKALGAVTIALEAAQGEAAFADQSRAFEVEDAMELKTALRAILTARNITQARKIARDALGEE